jgi:hypothetical protein
MTTISVIRKTPEILPVVPRGKSFNDRYQVSWFSGCILICVNGKKEGRTGKGAISISVSFVCQRERGRDF